MRSIIIIFISEHAAHVDFLLGGLLLLLGLLGGCGISGDLSDGGTTCGGGGSGGDVGEEGFDVLSFEGLGEKSGPVAFNGVAGGLDDLGEFIGL